LQLGEEIKTQLRFLNAEGSELRVGRHLRHPSAYLVSVEKIHKGADDKQPHQRRDFDPLSRHITS
jgi:hypothetical protein